MALEAAAYRHAGPAFVAVRMLLGGLLLRGFCSVSSALAGLPGHRARLGRAAHGGDLTFLFTPLRAVLSVAVALYDQPACHRLYWIAIIGLSHCVSTGCLYRWSPGALEAANRAWWVGLQRVAARGMHRTPCSPRT